MGASTPHFALQLRNRIRRLIGGLPADHPARVLGEQEIARLDALGFAGEMRGEPARPDMRDARERRRRRRAPSSRPRLSQRRRRPAPAPRASPAARCPARSPSAPTPRSCASGCASSRASSCSARCGTSAEPAKVYFELRDGDGAVPCSMWRNDFERLGRRARRDGAQVVARRRPATTTPARDLVAVVLLRATGLRIAGEGDLLAQMEPLRRQLARRGPASSRRSALPRPPLPRTHRRRHRRGRQGARRRARRPAPPRLGRAPGLGLRARAGPPRRAGDRAGAAGSRRDRGGRGDRRRARRRLAGRPVRLLRRDAVPHRRAAARAGDRLGRPPHRPHADRRRRGRQLLDADACRRVGGAARLRAGARGAAARGAPARRARAPRRRRRARARSPRWRARPPSTSRATAARCTSSCASCARAPRRGVASERELHRARARLVLARKARRAPPAPDDAPPRRAALDALRLALAAHDPERTVARGYAIVDDGAGGIVTSAPPGPRAAATSALFFGDGDVRAIVEDRRRHDEGDASDQRTATRPPARASRRSSGAWTPARPACARRSTSCRGPRAGRVLRRRAGRGRPGPRGAAPRRARRAPGARRPSGDAPASRADVALYDQLADLPLEIEDYALERLQRDVSSGFSRQTTVDPPARRRPRGPRRGRQLRRRRPRRPAGRRARLAAGRQRTLASFCDHLDALDLWPASRRATRPRASTASGPTSRPRSTSRCARPACRCTRRSAASRGR